MRCVPTFILGATIFAVLTGVVARGDIITNGSFEAGAYIPNFGPSAQSLSVGSTAIAGWQTFNAELTWLQDPNPFNGIVASSGVYSLDLTGIHDSSPYGGVRQSIATLIGQAYVLSFDLGDNTAYPGNAGVLASAGSTASAFNFTSSSGQQWQRFTLPFTATSTSTLISFIGQSNTPSAVYIGLDNISVVAVPEPSSILWTGFTFMACLKFSRKRIPRGT